MTVKKELQGLLSKSPRNPYHIEEINIISDQKVIYSGPADGWVETDIDMLLYKKQIENMEVVNRMIFNNRKAFIFIGQISFGHTD